MESARAWSESMRLSLRLVAVGFLCAGIDFDHAAPDEAGLILEGAFVKQVAFAVRGLMVLERVIGKVLLAFGEHDAVDLSMGVFASEGDVLIHFGEAACRGRRWSIAVGRRLRQRLFDGRSARRRVPQFCRFT